ncbi:MAG: hypothetical protein V4458_11135 [Pseudomonadota bacterium]
MTDVAAMTSEVAAVPIAPPCPAVIAGRSDPVSQLRYWHLTADTN